VQKIIRRPAAIPEGNSYLTIPRVDTSKTLDPHTGLAASKDVQEGSVK